VSTPRPQRARHWRYAFGQQVYVEGSADPHSIEAHAFTEWRADRRQVRTYLLRTRAGHEFWLDEQLILETPGKDDACTTS
jgi:hypothetical protein